MDSRFHLILKVAAVLCAATSPAIAQNAFSHRPLITDRIDEQRLVALPGNTRPEARTATDDAVVAETTRLDHIHLLLKRTANQERMVEDYVDGLTRHGSPTYHHWLSAAEFGKRFGASDTDVARISVWLEGKGLRVNHVYPNRMMIDFSGNAGQVARAFHTEIHRFEVGGAIHLANTRDPEIPAALAPAIAGIVSLNDFHPRNTRRPRRADTAACGSPCQAVGAGDLAVIYDLKPLFAAGYTGRGQVIAAVESTDLYDTADWSNFRSAFGLNSYSAGSLQIVHPAPAGDAACDDPGVTGDDGEAALDVEWASAAAPGATIMLASCASTGATDGVFLAIQNIVNSAAPPAAISVSYAVCEAFNGAAENAAFNAVYQQAAAEGISVFVASGDSGSSGCAPGPDATFSGIGVNGWGDSQYNISVGGTDFLDTFEDANSRYWGANAGAPWTTALSYVPEIPWNDTCANPFVAQYFGRTNIPYGTNGFCNTQNSFHTLSSTGGGPSRCYSGAPDQSGVVGGSCRGYPKPAWQRQVFGYAPDGMRDTPDVAMFAADGVFGHSYATCFTDPNNNGGPCTGNPVFWKGNGGGTSYGAPIMAGIQALVNQYTGSLQGNPAPVYYALAASQYGSSGNPNCSANLGRGIESDCIFHDIIAGNNSVYCSGGNNCYLPSGTYGVLSTSLSANYPAYKGKSGYDATTGIGSVDAYNLVVRWP